jgi:membrane associated rhomboid family serine protease
VFVPIHDANPLQRIALPVVTWLLIVANIAVFALQSTTVSGRFAASFAIIPAELLRVGMFGGPAMGPHDALAIPESYTLLSYMFLHGDILHLAGNMLFLWVFGDNVEDALGHLRYLAFYLACGVAGGAMHAAILPTSDVPLIGASAAVAGVVTAYLILYPRVLVWVLVLRFIPIRITAGFALGAWILTQLFMAALPYLVPGAQIGPVAWWAHVGGILAGGVLVLLLRKSSPTPLGGGGTHA